MNRNFWITALITFINFLSLRILIPIIHLYGKGFGLSDFQTSFDGWRRLSRWRRWGGSWGCVTNYSWEDVLGEKVKADRDTRGVDSKTIAKLLQQFDR